MEDFEIELKASFLEEAEQLLIEVEKCYLDLESNPHEGGILDQIFRVAHNLKGSAKAVGFKEVGEFAHQFENLLLKLKNRELDISPEIVSLLLRSNDHLSFMIQELKNSLSATIDSSELLSQINDALEGKFSAPEESFTAVPSADAFDETTEIDAGFLSAPVAEETLFSEEASPEKAVIEEPPPSLEMAPPMSLNQPTLETFPPSSDPSKANTPPSQGSHGASNDESIRVSLARLEKLLNYVGEMVILQTVLKEQAQSSEDLLKKTVHQLGKVTKEVQDISMSLRMVPIKSTFQKMQRIVRDTTIDLGKKIQLQISGEETELDKTILERINDPLVHLIRNACDHGVEATETRQKNGKPEQGTIRLSAFHQNGKLVIEVADDGGGINPQTLRQKAIEKRIIGPNTVMTEQELIHLIFHPGFSTKAVVTNVSGRGVGMDVVKHNIESLQGEVLVETKLGLGTTFKIILPLTLAIIDAMIVKLGDSRFVIPLSHVHESVKLDFNDIKSTAGLGELLLLRGETIPLFRLNNLVGRKSPPSSSNSDLLIALVIHGTNEHFAVLVDDIIGQYQVVIKQLGSELQNIKGFTGSSILGDGKPALILELAELVARHKNSVTSNSSKGLVA